LSTDNPTSLHQAARNFALAGIPVFPCEVGGKKPATYHGHQDATTDLETIDSWWSAEDYNIGMSPHDAGWCVVDLDPGSNDAWIKNPLPDTYAVKTPRDGLHLYYEGELPSTVSKLGDHIDTRGIGGYVLVPPSIVDGKAYEVLHDRDIAPLPGWIADRLKRGDTPLAAAIDDLDRGENIARARVRLADYVERGDVAISGRGGNSRTYKLACELSDLGLSPSVSLELLEEIWNPHCIPPWSHDELGVITDNASRYVQNEAGAHAVGPASEVFAEALDKPANAPAPDRKSKFHFEDEAEQELGKDPSWIIQDLIPESATVLLVGKTGSYKSFLALDMALSIASGQETFGGAPQITGPTFYGALEGRTNIKKARRRAWRLAHGVDGPIKDFYVGTAPMIGMEGECQEFGEQIVKRCQGRRPVLVILDTTSKSMAGLNENDAGDAGRFIRFCDSLKDELGCTVIAIHHTGKDDTRGARGSSAFQAGFDTVLEAKAHRATKAVAIYVRKHKDAEEREIPWTFEGKVVGPSLVFFPTNADEHKALVGGDDPYTGTKIGAALQALNAYGPEQGVTTAVLASQITPASEGRSVEDHQALLNKIGRTLNGLARSRLVAYSQKVDRVTTWFLPAPVPDARP
jgi:hypothetical protein